MVTKRIVLLVMLGAAIIAGAWIAVFLAGCSNDSSSTGPKTTVDGILLLGLVNGHTLTYQQVDTVTTFYPVYSQTVSTQTRMINVAGTGADWVVRENGEPIVNLKVSSPYVLQNGVWKKTGAGDSLIYFLTPPVVMQQQFEKTRSWDGLMPMYPSESGDIRYPFFNYYFGFYFKRQYAGTEQLLLPAGAYTCYRFDVDLYFDTPTHATSDSLPAAVATEFYAKDVGLVKLTFNGQGLNRTVSLITSQ